MKVDHGTNPKKLNGSELELAGATASEHTLLAGSFTDDLQYSRRPSRALVQLREAVIKARLTAFRPAGILET